MIITKLTNCSLASHSLYETGKWGNAIFRSELSQALIRKKKLPLCQTQ